MFFTNPRDILCCMAKKYTVIIEKDAVRLVKFRQELKDLPFFVLPISIGFLFEGKDRFNDLIINFIRDFRDRNDHHNE